MENVSLAMEGVAGVMNSTTWTRVDELQFIRAQTILVVQKIIYPIVVGFGCFGNTITIVVLTRPWMKSSTNYYLTVLAIYDILYLVFALSMSLEHYRWIGAQYAYMFFRAYIGRTLTDIWSNTGIWLTVTFTVERYIVVCHPMKGVVWCTPKRAKYILAAVCVAAAAATFPEFFSLEVAERERQGNNTILYRVRETDYAHTPGYMFGYQYINQALFTFLPLVLLFAFNTFLIRALISAAKQRNEMTRTPKSATGGGDKGGSDPQQKITLMLICVVIVFLFCQLPSALALLYWNVVKATLTLEEQLTLRIVSSIFNLLVMINSSVNYVLYSSFSTKFRVTFKRLFCKCLDEAGGKGGGGGGGKDSANPGGSKQVRRKDDGGTSSSTAKYTPVAV